MKSIWIRLPAAIAIGVVTFGPSSLARGGHGDELVPVASAQNREERERGQSWDEEPDPDGRPMRAGSLIVKFRSGTDEPRRQNAHRSAGSQTVERLLAQDTVRVDVGRSRGNSARAAYLADPAVERVEPDLIVRALLTPNDSNYPSQWGITKIRAGGPAQSAWDLQQSNPAIRVAVLDCGVNTNHPDISGKVMLEANFSGSSGTNDVCNHGTHVAGIAAAKTNNGVGVGGVGFNASLINGKVLGDTGSGSFSSIINGILWAAGCDTNPCGLPRAQVINMSLGATASCSSSVQSAVTQAWNRGLVIVAAAGNSGASGAITPANCANVIGVAASDINDAKASFSNFGSGVDVAAPGVGILSTNNGTGYSSFSGTSMASPHVAGLAALLTGTSLGPTNQAIVSRIFCTANENALAGSTHGRIDALAAVDPAVGCGVTPPPPPTSTSTGWRSPTANGPLPGGDGNGFETNPGNAQAADNSFAVDNNSGASSSTSCTSSNKDKHAYQDYGLAIPAGAAIAGIQVQLDARADSASGSPRMCVQLSWNGGATWTSAKATSTLTATERPFVLGNPTDTWGHTWTAGELSNASFRVRVTNVASSSSRDFFLDWVGVQVHYQQ